jgi:hypothetical protein
MTAKIGLVLIIQFTTPDNKLSPAALTPKLEAYFVELDTGSRCRQYERVVAVPLWHRLAPLEGWQNTVREQMHDYLVMERLGLVPMRRR